MILKNSLYKIEKSETEGQGCRYHLALDPDHFIYQAHFPGQPITPGACLIQMAKELLEEHLSQALLIQHIKDVKFIATVSPIDTPHIIFNYQKISETDPQGEVKATVSIEDGEKVYSTIVFTCKAC